MTKRLRLLVCIILSVSFLTVYFPVNITANYFTNLTIDSHSMLDLSSRRVSGEAAQYFIDFTTLHQTWVDGVVAERDIVGGNSPVIERVRFYVRSITRPQSSEIQPMFAIYVICRAALNCESEIPFPLEMVSRSRDFVFAVRYEANGFIHPNDRAHFYQKVFLMNTAIRMREFITLPPSQVVVHSNTAFIFGAPMNSQIHRQGGIAYIQLREAAEMMGFFVGWHEPTTTVTIIRGNLRDSFMVYSNMTHDHRDIPMLLRNGRTYVAVSYFITILRNSISIDQSNIWIS